MSREAQKGAPEKGGHTSIQSEIVAGSANEAV
jgi:hypothetical protein